MKKLLFLFTFYLFFINKSNSQSYVPLPDSGGTWVNAHYQYFGYWIPYLAVSKAYCTNGSDTIINSTSYTKVLDCNGGTYKGAFRNSTGKVFYVPGDSLQEFLLYDFTVSAYDTIYNVYSEDFSGSYPSITFIVIQPNSIDSVLIGSTYRKRIWIYGDTWIEGIGSDAGLLLESNLSPYYFNRLDCMSLNDTILYPYYGAGACDITLSEKKFIVSDFSVYPNPVRDNFVIEFPEIVSAEVYVYNNTGQKVSSTLLANNKKTEINFSGLPSGLYNIVCISNDKIITRKIVKE